MTTAVTIAPTPILQFFNNQTQPCVGGSVLTQVGGVNTATYQDSAGTIALPNPIPLNNRGEISNASGVSCQLFLAAGVAYTFTLFDANGNQLNQASYVATSNGLAIFIASLLSSIGSSLVGFIQAGAGAVLSTVQSRLRDAVHVTDFGAVGDNVADDTAAVVAANAVAIALKKALFFPTPPIAYKVNPVAAMLIQHWRGEDVYNTVINVANSYAGEFIRVLPQGTLEEMTIQAPGLTKTAGSVGIRVSATLVKDICVNPTLRRLYVRGFDKNIDLQNVYLLHADHVHSESGNYGAYCVPDATTLGYITTHTWVNCDFGNNGVNVYYNPANYSNTVTFLGGNISGATGAYQSFFNKVRVLKFVQTYFEQSPTIKAVNLGDVDYVSFDGGFLNGTGGIMVGSGVSTRLRISSLWGTTSTDNITGADGNQMLSLYDSNLGSGSSATNLWKTLEIKNSNYSGSFYASTPRFKETFQSGGGTVTLDANNGNAQRLTVIDGVAFAFAPIANAVLGQAYSVAFQNSSGGALGAVTLNAAYKVSGFANAATGFQRTLTVIYDGALFHQVGPASTDIAN